MSGQGGVGTLPSLRSGFGCSCVRAFWGIVLLQFQAPPNLQKKRNNEEDGISVIENHVGFVAVFGNVSSLLLFNEYHEAVLLIDIETINSSQLS